MSFKSHLAEPPSRTNRLALLAAVEACRAAGMDAPALRSRRVGVCIGTTVGCTLNNEPFYRAWKAGELPDPEPVRRYLAGNPALWLAKALGLRGPVATIANACSSGTDAIGQAKSWIERGLCGIAIAGGADELSRVTYLGFISLMITSPEPCRPFDRDRRGLNLGEGAGMLLLANEEALRGNGAGPGVFAEGFGTSTDAYHPTAPHPEGRGLRQAIRVALEQAGADAGEIGLVNAHGTSTPDNDRVEGRVLTDLLAGGTPAVSTKGYTGHTLGAAGGIEAALTVRALLDERLPATVGFETPDPDCVLIPTTALTDVSADLALSTSLAFGGTNSALLFRRGKRDRGSSRAKTLRL